jgi:tRNA A37 threonylcarbamoyladenosine dehydratase
VLCDYDRVTVTGLNESALFAPGDVGRGKAEAGEDALSRLCPDTVVSFREEFIHGDSLPDLLPEGCGLLVADAIDA